MQSIFCDSLPYFMFYLNVIPSQKLSGALVALWPSKSKVMLDPWTAWNLNMVFDITKVFSCFSFNHSLFTSSNLCLLTFLWFFSSNTILVVVHYYCMATWKKIILESRWIVAAISPRFGNLAHLSLLIHNVEFHQFSPHYFCIFMMIM